MNFRLAFAALLLLSVALASCSGLPKTCTVNCGGGGNATLSVTLTAAPLTPPPNTNLLSFIVGVNTITLTTSTGTNVNIPLNNTSFSVDLTKLQSDSAFLGTSATVPAGSYTSMTVSLTNPVVTFCTQTLGNTGCAAGSVTTISGGAAAAPIISSAPFPLTLTANQQTGLALNFNLGNALTVNASQVVTAVNLSAANVLSANSLPSTSTSLATGQLDFVEDVTGVVTTVNSTTQSVTVQTATHGSITAVTNSSTVFSPNCTAFSLSLTFSSCVVQGDVASLDLVLNPNGTFTLLEYDPLATTTGDWVEGVVTAAPSSSTQFSLVTNDAVFATSGSLISSSLSFGAAVNVTLVGNPQKPFVVDTKGLVVPTTVFSGGTDTSVLAPGQTVAAHITAFTAGSGSTLAKASADSLYLRFTRVTGTVASVAPPNTFSMQSFPTFFALTTPITVQLSTGSPSTNFDGISSSSSLTAGQTVSISALYFGPPVGTTSTPTPFSAAKVRVP
jgi:Domain of unknown function (DUF4382)